MAPVTVTCRQTMEPTRRRLWPSIAAALLVAACSTAPAPDSMGTLNPAIAQKLSVTSELSACLDDPAVSSQAGRAQEIVSSWFEIAANLQKCDRSRLWYYASPRFERQISTRLASVRQAGGTACVSEVVDLQGRVNEGFGYLRQWHALTQNMCDEQFLRRLSRDQLAAAEREIRQLACAFERLPRGADFQSFRYC